MHTIKTEGERKNIRQVFRLTWSVKNTKSI